MLSERGTEIRAALFSLQSGPCVMDLPVPRTGRRSGDLVAATLTLPRPIIPGGWRVHCSYCTFAISVVQESYR